jgi:ethanolaminephosphotransferase
MDLKGPISTWFYVLAGVCQFLYVHFDNMDGKQARRTGNSSPLGLLFDHGCDSNITYVSILTFCHIFQLGGTIYMLMMIVAVTAGFYFATLEEYYVGGLFLPIINGVSDGAILLVAMSFFGGFVGWEWWAESAFGYEINKIQLLVLIMFLSNLFVVLKK